MSRSAELFREAQQYLAGGVSRNTVLRAPYPYYVARGEGCRVYDVDGVERIDFANNMASLIHGHAHPAIVEAVSRQVARGTAFTMPTEVEIEYARHLIDRSPCFDRVRFVNSGTEAVMAAIKAARAFTGRTRIAKAEGAYHGAYDYAEVSQAPRPSEWGSARHPNPVPLADGTPPGLLEDVIVLPFNNPDAVFDVLEEHQEDLACILLDLMPHRLGLVPAEDPFVHALGDWIHEHGALLVFDEVITFRTEYGGMQERYSIDPDLTAMGKIIGGGLPVGAVAGHEDVMEVFSSQNGPPPLPHSGTFSANPLTMSAGLAAMKAFDREAVARLNRLGDLARQQIEEAIEIAGVPASISGAGSMFRIHLRASVPRDYRSSFLTSNDKAALKLFSDSLYDEGIMMIHTGGGTISTPMEEAEIDRLAEAVLVSLRKVKGLLVDEEE